MTEETDTGNQRRTVFGWAQGRAACSDTPGKFMNKFEDNMRALLALGVQEELERIDESRGWQAPVDMAAEIEALSAFRALQHWGTEWGLCPGRWSDGKRYQQDARGRLAGRPAGKQSRRR